MGQIGVLDNELAVFFRKQRIIRRQCLITLLLHSELHLQLFNLVFSRGLLGALLEIVDEEFELVNFLICVCIRILF